MTEFIGLRDFATNPDLSDRINRHDPVRLPAHPELAHHLDRRDRHRNGGQAKEHRDEDCDEECQGQVGRDGLKHHPRCIPEKAGGGDHTAIGKDLTKQIISRVDREEQKQDQKRHGVSNGRHMHPVSGKCADGTEADERVQKEQNDQFSAHAATPLSENRNASARPKRGGTAGRAWSRTPGTTKAASPGTPETRQKYSDIQNTAGTQSKWVRYPSPQCPPAQKTPVRKMRLQNGQVCPSVFLSVKALYTTCSSLSSAVPEIYILFTRNQDVPILTSSISQSYSFVKQRPCSLSCAVRNIREPETRIIIRPSQTKRKPGASFLLDTRIGCLFVAPCERLGTLLRCTIRHAGSRGCE